MANVRGGISGAASGAAAGSPFGPWGTAIGGVAGGLAGLFGGDDDDEERLDEAEQRNKRLASRLRGMFGDAQDQSAADTQIFQQGMAQAQEQTERQADRDEAQAAARGLTGSQFEIAQGANRIRALANTQRNLLSRGEQQLQQERARYLRAWLNQEDAVTGILQGRAQQDARNRRAGNQMLMDAFATAGSIWGPNAGSSSD